MGINLADIAIQIAITIAIVNYIKTVSKKELGYFAVLIAIVVAFGITILGILPAQIVWLDVIKNTFIVSLASAGIYDLRQGFTK